MEEKNTGAENRGTEDRTVSLSEEEIREVLAEIRMG